VACRVEEDPEAVVGLEVRLLRPGGDRPGHGTVQAGPPVQAGAAGQVQVHQRRAGPVRRLVALDPLRDQDPAAGHPDPGAAR